MCSTILAEANVRTEFIPAHTIEDAVNADPPTDSSAPEQLPKPLKLSEHQFHFIDSTNLKSEGKRKQFSLPAYGKILFGELITIDKVTKYSYTITANTYPVFSVHCL